MAPASAQIRSDGSVGPAAQTLAPGGAYTIAQSLGRLSGTNLFHSFSDFNLNAGESASFTTTSAGVSNVISRVTGGSVSIINGPLRLAAAAGSPGFWFINPAGVVFGAGASIDVPGGFHVSTASYLKFADGNFYADKSKTSSFSSAEPQAFGFLGAGRGAVELSAGARLENRDKALSVVAGDVTLDGGSLSNGSGSTLVVAFGAAAGEVSTAGLATQNASGAMKVLNGAWLGSESSGAAKAGDVSVMAGSLRIDGQGGLNYTGIASDTVSGEASGAAGAVHVHVTGAMEVLGGAMVSSNSYGAGNAGNVTVSAGTLLVDSRGSLNYTGIASDAQSREAAGSGSAGTVSVQVAGSLRVLGGAVISSNSFGGGGAGTISVGAGSLTVQGQSNEWAVISSDAYGNGNAGAVHVNVAGAMQVLNGGRVSSDAWDKGHAGNVSVKAGSLRVDGQGSLYYTGISSDTLSRDSAGAGDAGALSVQVGGAMELLNGGQISSLTRSAGHAGSVVVSAGQLSIDGSGSHGPSSINASAQSGSSGQTGSVAVSASESLAVQNAGQISIRNDATLANPQAIVPTALTISAPTIHLLNDGQITAQSTGNVAASNMAVNFADWLMLDATAITASALDGNGGSIALGGAGVLLLKRSAITTSVTGSSGNAGSISLGARALVLENGFIQANTAAPLASGGTIAVSTQALIPSYGSLRVGGSTPYAFDARTPGANVIQAASPTGVSGSISITSPKLDLAGGLVGLKTGFLDSGGFSPSPCAGSSGSSFAQTGRGGLPPSALGPLGAGAPAPGKTVAAPLVPVGWLIPTSQAAKRSAISSGCGAG